MTTMQNFDFNTVKRGEEITEEVYRYFLNIASPRSICGGVCSAGFQLCEAANSFVDTRTGKKRPVYATFGYYGKRWYYLGLNFQGEACSMPYIRMK